MAKPATFMYPAGYTAACQQVFMKYLDEMFAYIKHEKVKDPWSARTRDPDEILMRRIEEKINIPETAAHDFRCAVATRIGTAAHKGQQYSINSDPYLKQAIEKYLEDQGVVAVPEIVAPVPKYRQTDDPWEPAW